MGLIAPCFQPLVAVALTERVLITKCRTDDDVNFVTQTEWGSTGQLMDDSWRNLVFVRAQSSIRLFSGVEAFEKESLRTSIF